MPSTGHRSSPSGAASKPEPGVDQHALGINPRPGPDGTYQGDLPRLEPLYLYIGDAYIPGIPGISGPSLASTGAGKHTPWGVFNTIPPLPQPLRTTGRKAASGQGESGLPRYKSLAPGGTSEVSACVETTDLAVTPFGGAELLRKTARAPALPRPPCERLDAGVQRKLRNRQPMYRADMTKSERACLGWPGLIPWPRCDPYTSFGSPGALVPRSAVISVPVTGAGGLC